jgi:cytochrome c peroxidase
MLAGRVKAQGLYGWHGESPDLPSRIAAGFGLHRWRTSNFSLYDQNYRNDEKTTAAVLRTLAGHLVTFLREGLVPPPREERALTEEEERGKQLFMSPVTRCAKCHVPETGYTDRSVVELRELKPPKGFAQDPSALYKVPGLSFVGGTAPYMHDGRFESLESLLEYNQDRMGKTSQLSDSDRKALIAFLRTL